MLKSRLFVANVGRACLQSSRTEFNEKIKTQYNTEMFENPYIKAHQHKRDGVSKDFYKQTTGLTGLYVNENPQEALLKVYKNILLLLVKMPQEAQYRKSTEKIVKERLNLVEGEEDIKILEEKIGMGQIEEVIEQANYELETARMIFEYKPWDPLIEKPEKDQWKWPIH